jgi:hypothetical protein
MNEIHRSKTYGKRVGKRVGPRKGVCVDICTFLERIQPALLGFRRSGVAEAMPNRERREGRRKGRSRNLVIRGNNSQEKGPRINDFAA